VYTEKAIEICRPTDAQVTNGHHRVTSESAEHMLEPNFE
jgi:hypothetical protein